MDLCLRRMKGVVSVTLKQMWLERMTAKLHRDHRVKLLVVQLGRLNRNMYK